MNLECSLQSHSQEHRMEGMLLLGLAIIPLAVFLWMTLMHQDEKPTVDFRKDQEFLLEKMPLLEKDLNIWDALTWSEKENAVAMGVESFRQTRNTAILKSPQHYVVLINRLLEENHSAKDQNLFTVLSSLAIQEYDFFNGADADLQARQLLGPELFEVHKKYKKVKEEEFFGR